MEDILKTHPAYKMSREEYGLFNELDNLQEECAELISAISKTKKTYEKDISVFGPKFDNFLEEIGDVENLLQQMKFWFPEHEKTIKKKRLEKLDRLEEKFQREINYKLYTFKKFKKEIEEKEPFILEIIRDKKIMLIGNERELRKISKG